MRYPIKIFSDWRKVISIVLLILFTTSTVLWAYPSIECNMVCRSTSEAQSCCSELIESSSCCSAENKLEATSPKILPQGVKISNLSCRLELHKNPNPEYLLPKVDKQQFTLVEISNFDFEESESKSKSSDIRDQIEYTYDYGPPIYIRFESFLI